MLTGTEKQTTIQFNYFVTLFIIGFLLELCEFAKAFFE